MPPVTLEEVQAAIDAGRPATFDTAATAFGAALTTLQDLTHDIPASVDGVIGSGRSWQGPAATMFGTVTDELVGFIADTAKPLEPYGSTLTTAGGALTTAQSDINAYAERMAKYRSDTIAAGGTPDEAAIDAGAREILERLAEAYRAARPRLAAIPETPADVADGDGGGGETGGGEIPSTLDTSGSSNLLGGPPGSFAGSSGSVFSGLFGPPALDGLVSTGSAGLPSFGLTAGTGDPSTVLTGLAGPLGGSPMTPPQPAVADPLAGGRLFGPGFGAAVPGSTVDPAGRGGLDPRPGPLTAADRIPGVGAAGYNPSGATTVRSGSVPPLWSQYGAGAGGALGGPRGVGRRSGRKRTSRGSVVVPTDTGALLPLAGSGRAGRERRAERTTTLVGDEDWTGVTGGDAIGRPRDPDRD